MVDTQLAVFQPSQSAILNTGLAGLEQSLERAARANMESAIAQSGGDFTETERHAMQIFEELKMVNDIDLTGVLLRGKLLRQIEDEALWTIHPNTATAATGGNTLAVIAKEVGCSVSELSNTKDLCNIIFPFMTDRLGMNISQAWEELGKSNFRELVSVMKSIITGVPSVTNSTRQAVERALNDTAATALAAGQHLTQDELRETAVSNLLLAGGQMTTAELRDHVRNGEETPAINTVILIVDGRRLVISDMDEDQFLMWQRKMGRRVETTTRELPADARQRRIEAARIPAVRNIANLINGE